MKAKKLFLVFIFTSAFPARLLMTIMLAGGCLFTSYLLSQGSWTPKASLPALARWAPVGFTIGGKGYLGTGLDAGNNYLADFWEYDPIANSWAQKANFGGGMRAAAVGFTIGNYGYIGTGEDGGSVLYNDFWKYDANANTWTQVANVGGPARGYACGFSVNGKGYIGTGISGLASLLQDLWEYDPVSNTWASKVNYLGGARWDIDKAVFVICNKAYMGTGGGGTGTDFWEYDPITNTWTQKTNFPGPARIGATGFSIGNRGFLGLGQAASGGFVADFWKYNPFTNSWSAVAAFPGAARFDSPSFVINNKAYVGNSSGNTVYNDLWEYIPDSVGGGILTAVIVSSSNTICFGQSLTLSASVGSTYSWSNGSTNNPIIVSPITTTTYSVMVSDTAACGGSDMAVVTIAVTNIIMDIPTVVNTNCDGQCTGSATASANGGTPTYTYSWSTVPIQNTATATGLCAGTYTCTISDVNGCTNNVSVTVAEIPCPCPTNLKLTIPNAFSPDSDGENDEICLQGGIEDCIREVHIFIYDRWGKKVYESSDKKFCWDGRYRYKFQNTAVFVYYLEAILVSGEIITKKGNVSLIK